jgi:hypothetical protein
MNDNLLIQIYGTGDLTYLKKNVDELVLEGEGDRIVTLIRYWDELIQVDEYGLKYYAPTGMTLKQFQENFNELSRRSC